MTGQELRQKFMRQFVGMKKYSQKQAWLIVSFYLVQIGASVVAGGYLLSLTLSWLTISMMIILSIFIGTRLRGLNNIVHECSHSTFCEEREDNVTLGRLCASLLLGCFKEYKHDHLSHHAHLGDYGQDREMGPIELFGLHDEVSAKTIFRYISIPLTGRHLKVYSGINLSGSDGALYLGLKAAILIAMAGLTIAQPYAAILFVLVPMFYILPTINFWTDCLDHAGIVAEDDELKATRNVLAPTPVKLLFFPRNDCYHLVHHLFPQVPARHLETAHKELSKEVAYKERAEATKPTHQSITQFAVRAS